MPLQKRYAADTDIPEALREYYRETANGWELDISGDNVSNDVERLKQTLANEREQRRKAVQALEAFKKEMQDISPEQAREALQKLEELEQNTLRSNKQYEELAERKYAQQLKALQTKIEQQTKQQQEADQERNRYRDMYRQTTVETQLAKEALEQGVDPKKMRFLLNDLRDIWRLDDQNNLLPIDPTSNGELTPLYGQEGKPLTMKEQVGQFLKQYPYFVLESSGGGALHRPGGPRGNVTLTREQARDLRQYEAAKSAAEKAGVAVEII